MAKRPEVKLPHEDPSVRICMPCCGWWLDDVLRSERRLHVCGRCGHWLMNFGDGVPVLLTQVEIDELPERAPEHAAEMVRITARLVDEAPCCKRALGHG